MSSPDPRSDRKRALAPLVDIARASIRYGLVRGVPLAAEPQGFAPLLQAPGASFVTLHAEGELRGCTGSLAALQPLVVDVARNAFAAAFLDPRFSPLGAEELPSLALHVSILGPQQPLEVATEEELLARLRPGVDGLVIEEGALRATFLPAVWSQLPSPRAFLEHLKHKAGLPAGYWSETIRVSRYEVEEIGE